MPFIFCLLFFLFVNTDFIYCYIDPGTGSMLFSFIFGLVSISFFAIKSAWIKIKTLPIWYRKSEDNISKSRKDIVIYSEGRQYWNVFKPIIEELNSKHISCHYYSSDEQDPCFNYKSDFIITKFIGKSNKAYAFLNMLEADICLMTTPGLDVYQLKRSKFVKHYSHILHATDDATFYKLFGLDYFDSVMLTGDYQKESIQKLEIKRNIKKKELITVGCTYLDELSKSLEKYKNDNINKEKITVLVSPSWGDNAILKKYGINLLLPLVKNDFHIIIRPHPQSNISEKSTLEKIKDILSSYSNVEWDFERENIKSMSKSDIMISDFSGIIFDYMFLLGRPVLYTSYNFDKRAYDCGDLEEEPWKFKILSEIGIKLTEEDFSSIGEIIREKVKNTGLINKIRQAKETAYFYQGEAGKKTVEALLKIRDEINKK